MDNFYRGYRNFKLTDDELAQFYKGEYEVAPGLENEYLIIYNEDEEPIDYFCWKNKEYMWPPGRLAQRRKGSDRTCLQRLGYPNRRLRGH